MGEIVKATPCKLKLLPFPLGNINHPNWVSTLHIQSWGDKIEKVNLDDVTDILSFDEIVENVLGKRVFEKLTIESNIHDVWFSYYNIPNKKIKLASEIKNCLDDSSFIISAEGHLKEKNEFIYDRIKCILCPYYFLLTNDCLYVRCM